MRKKKHQSKRYENDSRSNPPSRTRTENKPSGEYRPQRRIRNAARAIIIRDGHLLTIEMRDRDDVFYILPGGGQIQGETLHDTLRRECMEEIGAEIEIGDLLYVREYIGKNHTFSKRHKDFHQLESVFRCQLKDPEANCAPTTGDFRQIGVAWLPLAKIQQTNFYPKSIAQFFTPEGIKVPHIYLGDIN